MKAFALDRYGAPDVLTLRDFPEPEPGPTDLLVEIRAASVNPVDFKIRSGGVKVLVKDRFPLVLGCDCSGVVVRVGEAVTKFAVGDEVFARLSKERIGTFCERTLIDEAVAARKPANLSHVEAASIPLVGVTAWQALVEIAKLAPGQRVLVHAGSGGLGTFAIQLARHLGATVVTTASAKNRELLTRLGAHQVVDYKTERFEDVVAPCDVVFDTQGGETLERSFAVVKPGGVVVTVGGNPDAKFGKAWGLNPVLVLVLRFMMRKVTRLAKEKNVHFEYLFMRPDGEQLAAVCALLESGTIVPVLDRTFPFDATKEAVAYVEAGRSVGKVVIGS
ncbi:MAG: zinc-containing alcohol dehydrogenase [Myxococcaceae bacterium]|nr:zinc-containing alcohol dehydrogenase [Myxococcaceae bacterium]